MGMNATQNLLDDCWNNSVEAVLLKINNSIISIFLLFIFIIRLLLAFLFSHLSPPCLISPPPLASVNYGPVCTVDRLAKVNRKMWFMNQREGIALET